MKKNEKVIKDYFRDHLTLFDDRLFREAAENIKFVEELLRVFLNDKELKVIESTTQKGFSVLDKRGVILDCYCKLSNGRIVNIEVERNDEKDKCDHQRRVRYYGSMIDVKNLETGQEFKELPDVYVIYLTSKDIFKQGKTTYHVERVLKENNSVVDNGFHEIYINAEVNDKTDISEIMKIMSTKDYLNKNFKVISEVKEEKTMPVEVEKAFEELRTEYEAKGKIEGKAEGKAEMLIKLLNQGIISEEIVMSNLGINKEELEIKKKEFT